MKGMKVPPPVFDYQEQIQDRLPNGVGEVTEESPPSTGMPELKLADDFEKLPQVSHFQLNMPAKNMIGAENCLHASGQKLEKFYPNRPSTLSKIETDIKSSNMTNVTD